MSNIYEALEQAGREKTTNGVRPELSLQTEVVRGGALTTEMTWLHHQVNGLLCDSSQKLVQFIGARRGCGVSTLVREFAKVAVERYGKSVLVLDSAYQDPARRIGIDVTSEYGWLDLIEKGQLVDKAIFRVGETNLYFAQMSIQASLIPPVNDPALTVNLWNKLKEKFDLILIDSSSDPNSVESVAMTCYVDGVILVLEAEKTRRQVVDKLKKRIITNGGTIIGVVLNKRCYHIPDFIFKKFVL